MKHEPIDDPDIAQAVEDFRELALELRDRSVRATGLPLGDRHRAIEEQHIGEIMSRITVRAGRLGLTADELMVHLNLDLNRRARRGRPVPGRETVRTLADAVTERIAEEAVSHMELSAAQEKMRSATAARVAAEGAYAKYSAGRRV